MNQQEILTRLKEVVRDVLDDDEIDFDLTTRAEDVDGWDSLNHIQIVAAAEKKFSIKFLSSEIRRWKDVGQMVCAVERVLSNPGS